MARKRKTKGQKAGLDGVTGLYSTVRAWEEGLGLPSRAVLLRMEGAYMVESHFPITEAYKRRNRGCYKG